VRQRHATHHDGRRIHAQQPQALHPLGQAAVEVDVDAREAACIQSGQMGDQRLRAFGIRRDHRPDRVPAAEATQHREAARAAVLVEHHRGIGVAEQSSINAGAACQRAAASSACSVDRSASVAGRSRRPNVKATNGAGWAVP
jgi:hypothetical protein